MSFWNIRIILKDSGEKNIDIHDEKYIDLKFIITKVIEKYAGMSSFFDRAKNKFQSVYKTKDESTHQTDSGDITVTIMNKNLGFVNFHGDLSVKEIRVAKRELFLLKDI